ncbi:MAG: YifB family Mg chelatase-like AAA ATPase [Fibrobacterota bacterium]
MIAHRRSATLVGLAAVPVLIECEAGSGLPAFSIVGLPDGAVRESRDRILSALRHTGFRLPPRRITANLAPSDLRKVGTGFDLPLALAVLEACEQILPTSEHADRVFIGELGLDGRIRPVRGAMALAMGLRESGLTRIAIPAENLPEVEVVPDLDIVCLADFKEAVRLLEDGLVPERPLRGQIPSIEFRGPDMSDVRGQEAAKRALVVAAAGGHNVLMQGPPGSGKTLLARRFPGILPQLGDWERLEASRVHSVAGLLDASNALLSARPFRTPHHSASMVALVGGGPYAKPGEVSLAHQGVLFLDELAEFPRHALESLRQPLEDGEVMVCRAQHTVRYPCRCQVLAATNPCPCGYYGDRNRPCTCAAGIRERYQSRLSGPLLDRLDIHLEIQALTPEDLVSRVPTQDSRTLRAMVERSIRFRTTRQGNLANAALTSQKLTDACDLGATENQFLSRAAGRLGFSARSHDRILRVARTIADLEERPRVELAHLAEATAYRLPDKTPSMIRDSARAAA